MNIDTQQQAAVTVLTPVGRSLASDADEVGTAVKNAGKQPRSSRARCLENPVHGQPGTRDDPQYRYRTVSAGRVFKLAGRTKRCEVLALTEVGACEQFDDVTTAVRSFA